MSDWPAPPEKPVHMAGKVSGEGAISPYCASQPRALDLQFENWTLRWDNVTCAKCLAGQPT